MKSYLALTVGLILIIYSIGSLFTAIRSSAATFHVDFGCAGIEMNPPEIIKQNTRIAYCIDYISYYMISGSSVYASGETDQFEITVMGLEFKRVNQTLFVNKQRVEPGGSFETIERSQSTNPWLIETERLVIENAGISSSSATSPGKINVKGTMYADRSFSPLGLMLLLLGFEAFVYGYGDGGREQRVSGIVKPG